MQPELWGCVFSRSEHIHRIQTSFAAASVKLMPIWNYNPRLFFDIPHFVSERPEGDVMGGERWLGVALRQCRTNLKPHQMSALQFLQKNESANHDTRLLWNHPAHAWIRRHTDDAGIRTAHDETDNRPQGSILADNMGLGKTLTTLAYVLATRDLAVEYHWADWIQHSAATLVICPLATLSNWENEIRLHFEDEAITYKVFHGSDWNKLKRCDLESALVVLTTYEMIGESGNKSHANQPTIESLNLRWFRIVLDEAHLIRNPTANRTLNFRQLQSKFLLFLTGTPLQNCLTDLQSLITTLKVAPLDNELIWQRCLIPKMKVGAPEAIKSLAQLMKSICLRRTKDVLLNLPQKMEHAVVVQCSKNWEPCSRELHARFIRTFGRLCTSGELWDPAEFFQQLMMLRQFCNHPIFARVDLQNQATWRWQDSSKVVHLIGSLRSFLEGDRGIERTKAVIFSSFVAFLQMGLKGSSA
ncbi:hypothetical protein PTTG_25860 [Puccinia triticina 1-1 BBBD Race 1]|uniref:Helicase ATP-binding domain-containing protein n=1 Tax=Puccinia triticina (isolate 1-1 / race 1 (BBBD)) TaxID=630390 RepID=A0A180GZT1_PUCT1|nr:hypothetical protein PTTG_25860 [Puccinia triticina 1-1 BBBD Race 1]